MKRRKRRTRRENPETIITNQIRGVLHLMRVRFRKHWGGPMSPPGIPDLIGTLEGGRAFWCEVKRPGQKLSESQEEFLDEMGQAGAIAFMATSPQEVIQFLADSGYEPAKRLASQLKPEDAQDPPAQPTAPKKKASGTSDGELDLSDQDEEGRLG